MKLSEIAKLLSDRINQEHYVLHYLQQVYNAGVKKGKNLPPPTKKMQEEKGFPKELYDLMKKENENLRKELSECRNSLHQIHSERFTEGFEVGYKKATSDYKSHLLNFTPTKEH